jgi:hypothetical protein
MNTQSKDEANLEKESVGERKAIFLALKKRFVVHALQEK